MAASRRSVSSPARSRRTNKRGETKGLAVITIAIGALVVAMVLLQAMAEHPGIFVLLAVSCVLALSYWYKIQRQRTEQVKQRVEEIIQTHIRALRVRKLQLITTDSYGKPKIERWGREIEYFITNHIQPHIRAGDLSRLQRHTPIATLVQNLLEIDETRNPNMQTFSEEMSPSEFEAFCAEELRRNGWQARVTLQSRDQGVDVIAEKNGIRVVLQCKLYSSPVGNHAVQEAAAARAHEQAHFGIVVSNHRYTEPAQQLAATNGILLLHYRDLPGLDSALRALKVQNSMQTVGHS